MIKGTIFDVNNYRIGDYIYLDDPTTDQAFLDDMCDWFIDCYEKDNRFFLSVDLETQGLNPRYEKILLHSICWKKDQAILVRDRGFNFDKLKTVLDLVPSVGQNIKFDAKFLAHHYGINLKIMMDTMIAAKMGYTDSFPAMRFSLDAIVAAHFPFVKMDKQVRNSFIGRDYNDDFTLEEVEYAVGDSILTYWLVEPLVKRLILTKQWEMFRDIEMPVLSEFVATELHGIPVDYEGLGLYYDELGEILNTKYLELQDIVNRDIPEIVATLPKKAFNPKSSQQVPKVLSAYNIHIPSSAKDVLTALGDVNKSEIVTKINEFRSTADTRSKLVKGWYEEYTDLNTYRSYPNIFPYGANTGRFSIKEPPLQTVTQALRKFVRAEPGYSIVQWDYSSFELRALAAVTGQKQLIDVFARQAELMPDMMVIGQKIGMDDPDGIVKKFSKGEITNLTSSEIEIVNEYGNNDIHRMNASLMLSKDVSLIDPVERTIAKCVDLDTLVTTNKGLKTLRSLLPSKPKQDTYYDLKGLKVLSDVGWKDSPQIYYNGKKEGYRITTKLGRQINCTKVHKFRTLDKNGLYTWKLADDLSVGNELILNYQPGLVNKLSDQEQQDAILVLLNLLEAKGLSKGTFLNTYLTTYYDKVVRSNKDGLTIKDSRIQDLLNLKQIPDWIINADLKELINNSLSQYIFRLTPSNIYGNAEVLRVLQVALQNSGIASSLTTEPTCSALGIPFLNISSKKETVGRQVSDNLFKKDNQTSIDSLSKSAKKDYDFLVENNLYLDTIVSIKPLKSIEVGDLVVPDGNTLTYNGVVAHNTFGYATLYGSGPATIKEQLATDGIFFSLKETEGLITKFYEALDKVKEFFDVTHKFVDKHGYTETPLGRRRYFNIPPKWKSSLYQKAIADARRAGVNHVLQGCNADAIKIAIVEMMNEFRATLDSNDVPIIILQIHDELVLYCKTELAPYVSETCKKWMLYGGEKATMGRVCLNVSGGYFDYWQK